MGGLLSYKAEIIHSRVNLTYQIRVCRASTTLINVSLAVTYFSSIPFNLHRPVPALQKAAKMFSFLRRCICKIAMFKLPTLVCLLWLTNRGVYFVFCRFKIIASREDWESASLLLNPATVRPTLACIFQRYFDGFPF